MIKKEEILEAYKETGITPVDSVFIQTIQAGGKEVQCGCALTALYLHETNRDFKEVESERRPENVILKYFNGRGIHPTSFYEGFDLVPIHMAEDTESYDLGKETRYHLVKNGLKII
jgi:hypothetical protein